MEFHELQARLTKTVVFVTHDVDEAILLGDRMVVLNVGGIVEQYDTPEKVLAEPASDFVEIPRRRTRPEAPGSAPDHKAHRAGPVR